MSTSIDQQAQDDFIKCWNGFKPYEKPVYQEFKDGFLCGHQAATSRQEAKITSLSNALQSLSRHVERMRESGVVWGDVGPEQMAIDAIAAAKE